MPPEMDNENRPALVAFDLDGTLVDTMQGFADVAADVISERRGWTWERSREGYIETCGAPFHQQMELLFPAHADNAEGAAEFERRKEVVFYEARMDPAVKDALTALRDAGLRLAVTSNNFERLVRSMIEREAAGLFDEVLGFREGFAKGKDHFEALWTRFEMTPEGCVFVGDSLSDLKKAADAGTRFVGIHGTFARERFLALDASARTVGSVAELPALLSVRSEIN